MSSSLAFLTLLQDGPIPLAVVNAKGVVSLASQSFEQATGLTSGDPAPEWITVGSPAGRQLTLGERQFHMWAHPFLEGFLVVLMDRTELRRIDDLVGELRAHLGEVYARLEVRQRLLDRAQAALQAGKQLTATMAGRIQEDERQRELSAILRRHVSRDVADSITARAQPGLETHKSVLTVLFADLPAVDELVGDMESEELLEFLNEYQAGMTRIVHEGGGTVDSFPFASLKAFFGDPVAHEDHAVRAVRAAVRMKHLLQEMKPRWFPTAHEADLVMGIHTGYATVGFVGPEGATDFTAVGKNVALARALMLEAEPGHILMSGRTYDAVRDLFHSEAVPITLRGAARPMTVYKVLGERTPVEPTRLVPADPLLARPTRLGPYLVQEKLGEGGMAVVYRGLDEGLNRQVALKVLSTRMASDQKYLARFQREAQGLARLNSPYVAQIYFIGAESTPPFFAMEFVEGRTLREVIQAEGPLPVRRSLAYLSQMTQGLQAAAEVGIIHRDIKPDNVMIASKGTAKLMDFGLVKRADDESGVTQHGIILGTPRYMSPEQARCEEVDLRSDIYSLGATFFQMVSGRAPFDGDTALAIMRKHEVAPLPALATLPKGIPDGVYELVEKMMAKRREDRFQDYGSLMEAINRCQSLVTAR